MTETMTTRAPCYKKPEPPALAIKLQAPTPFPPLARDIPVAPQLQGGLLPGARKREGRGGQKGVLQLRTRPQMLTPR